MFFQQGTDIGHPMRITHRYARVFEFVIGQRVGSRRSSLQVYTYPGGVIAHIDTALRLARYFEMTEHFWMNLQATFELECARDELGASLDDQIPIVVSERLATYETKSD